MKRVFPFETGVKLSINSFVRRQQLFEMNRMPSSASEIVGDFKLVATLAVFTTDVTSYRKDAIHRVVACRANRLFGVSCYTQRRPCSRLKACSRYSKHRSSRSFRWAQKRSHIVRKTSPVFSYDNSMSLVRVFQICCVSIPKKCAHLKVRHELNNSKNLTIHGSLFDV